MNLADALRITTIPNSRTILSAAILSSACLNTRSLRKRQDAPIYKYLMSANNPLLATFAFMKRVGGQLKNGATAEIFIDQTLLLAVEITG